MEKPQGYYCPMCAEVAVIYPNQPVPQCMCGRVMLPLKSETNEHT